jgi:hypothetical protein
MSGVRTIRTARQYYDKMPTEQKQCRGRRFHIFADMDPTDERLDESIRITGLGRGLYRMDKDCTNECGLVRITYHRWKNGQFVRDHNYRPGYIHPDEWVTVPQGVITPEMITDMLSHDCARQIKMATTTQQVSA